MVMLADGVMARESDRAEVWLIGGGERHWVPDAATVDSLGGWGNVQIVWAPNRIDNPLGPMHQSVIVPQNWDDDSLITAGPDPAIYVMEGGNRRWIPDPPTFDHMGYDWNQVQNISSVEMNAIARGADLPRYLPAAINRLEVHTGPMFMGAGHWMETDAQFVTATGQVTGKTHTFTVTWFGGFHGGVYVILSDLNDFPVPNGQSPLWRYGVDGRWIGRSDRTDTFTWYLDLPTAQQVRGMTVFHTWAPDDFQTILNNWVAAAQSVGQLAQSVGQIAAVVAAIAS